MRKERLLKFKIKDLILMQKQETSKLPTKDLTLDNNGTSFLLTNTLSQRRVNSTKTSDFTSKEISTLFQHSQVENTLT
jgi:hypothetical protein